MQLPWNQSSVDAAKLFVSADGSNNKRKNEMNVNKVELICLSSTTRGFFAPTEALKL